MSTGNQDQLTKNMPKSGLINQFDLPTSGKERLKPPPVIIDPNKKVVKLGGSKVTTNEVCSVGERKKISFNSDRNISQRSPNKKSSDLNSIVINSEIKKKTPVTTGLDHVVINSNIKKGNGNGSECDKHRPSFHGLDSTNIDTGESDRTDSQQEGSTGQKSRTKIRLKRPSDIKIPSTEEILSHSDMCGVTDDTSNGCDSLCKEGDRDVTPEKPTPVLLSPKQRQLRLINQTLKQGETLNKDKVGSQTEGQKVCVIISFSLLELFPVSVFCNLTDIGFRKGYKLASGCHQIFHNDITI